MLGGVVAHDERLPAHKTLQALAADMSVVALQPWLAEVEVGAIALLTCANFAKVNFRLSYGRGVIET